MNSVLTVNTVATTYDLTTLATVKAELGLTTTAEDTNLATWITQASAACAAYCNRVFGLETVTEVFRNKFLYPFRSDNYRNIASIILTRTPVTSLDVLTQDGVILAADVDYQLDPEEGLIYRLNSSDDSLSQWYFKKLVVNYKGGYALVGTLPHNIERACITQVQAIRASASRDPNVKSENLPGVLSTTYWSPGANDNGALAPEVTALLDPYRNVSV
jgi:hypothetical protein